MAKIILEPNEKLTVIFAGRQVDLPDSKDDMPEKNREPGHTQALLLMYAIIFGLFLACFYATHSFSEMWEIIHSKEGEQNIAIMFVTLCFTVLAGHEADKE